MYVCRRVGGRNVTNEGRALPGIREMAKFRTVISKNQCESGSTMQERKGRDYGRTFPLARVTCEQRTNRTGWVEERRKLKLLCDRHVIRVEQTTCKFESNWMNEMRSLTFFLVQDINTRAS